MSSGSERPRASCALRRLALAFASWFLAACTSGSSGVVISEFLASNSGGLADIDGDTADWIELHNAGQAAVDLEGWCLTDNLQEPRRWCFPEVSIPAGGYLLVFASGKRTSLTSTELHATFKLKATEDYLALLSPSGTVVQEFAPYPDQKPNVSFGLTSAGAQGYLSRPTPEAPNGDAQSELVR